MTYRDVQRQRAWSLLWLITNVASDVVTGSVLVVRNEWLLSIALFGAGTFSVGVWFLSWRSHDRILRTWVACPSCDHLHVTEDRQPGVRACVSPGCDTYFIWTIGPDGPVAWPNEKMSIVDSFTASRGSGG